MSDAEPVVRCPYCGQPFRGTDRVFVVREQHDPERLLIVHVSCYEQQQAEPAVRRQEE